MLDWNKLCDNIVNSPTIYIFTLTIVEIKKRFIRRTDPDPGLRLIVWSTYVIIVSMLQRSLAFKTLDT